MPEVNDAIAATGVIAILRASSSSQLIEVAEAILAGGLPVMEVTLTTPGALHVIETAAQQLEGRAFFGAGSVLDAESARAAILAGAAFIVCPTLNLPTIELCRRYGVPVLPGALTPTEILTAWQAGADFVKLFPAVAGGIDYFKAVRQPLPQVKLVPVGGVETANTADFIRAGAVAVGVGGALVSQKLIDQRAFAEITARAQALRAAVAAGRSA